jgi:thiosulfate dehydrogenase [quinone] large subunit
MADPGDKADPGPRTATAAVVRSLALLPLRLFFGFTFLVAGLDKLLDAGFLDPANPASIQAQLAAFERFSPLAGLIRWAEPEAGLIGLAIAAGEVAIGLGAISGVAFRLAAAGGAALSLLFWLTASWATHPYYFGADLPYAIGWLALALAGHGEVLVPRWPAIRYSAARRAFLQTAALGVAAIAVSSAAASARALGLGGLAPGGQPAGGPSPTPFPSGGPPADPLAIASVAGLEEQRSIIFRVPFDAPAPLPAGDPGVLLQLPDGRFVAYDLICTHAACTVGWNPDSALLECPCHGATYDPAVGARVLSGPTTQPLAALPLRVDPATGTISLMADSSSA